MVTNIRIINSSHPRYAHEVIVPARAFGKRVRKRFTSKTKAEAYRREVLAKLDSATLAPLQRDIHLIASRYQSEFTAEGFEHALSHAIASRSLANPPLGELLATHLESQEKAFKRGAITLTTVRDDRTRTRALSKWLGTHLIRGFNRGHIEAFIALRLDEGFAPRSVRNWLRLLSTVCKRAVLDGLLSANPVSLVSRPKCGGRVSIVTPANLQKLIDHAHPITRHWLMFGAFAGLRTSEVDRLQWEDVRPDEGQLYVREGKTRNAERWVDLTPPLLDYLYHRHPESGLVMGGRADSTLLRYKRATYKAAGYEVPKNALRHSFGSHHLVGFGDPAKTATEMGHYSPQQTFNAYRRAVTKTQATAYWAIRFAY